MPFFASYQLSVEDVEKKLMRPVGGDPSGGERALLLALNGDRLSDVRRILQLDPNLGPDFRELIEERLRAAQLRPGAVKSWTVVLPVEVLEDYARLARLANTGIGTALREAVLRDYRVRQEGIDAVAALSERVLGYHRAASQVLEEAKGVVARLGSVQDLSMRLTRLEKALGSVGSTR